MAFITRINEFGIAFIHFLPCWKGKAYQNWTASFRALPPWIVYFGKRLVVDFKGHSIG